MGERRCCLSGWVLLALALPLSGCAGWLEFKAGRTVTGALAAVPRPENRRNVEALLTSPEMQESARVLTRAALDGAVAELSGAERKARLHELAAAFVDGLGPALGRTLDAEVLPRVRRELVAGVQAALDQALSPDNRVRLGAVAGDLARQAMAAASPQVVRAISDGVAGGIDRSVRQVLDRDLSAAVGRAIDANTPAFARAMRAGTEGALLGAADALKGDLGQVLQEERLALVHELERVAQAERKAWIADLGREVEASRRRWVRGFVILAAASALLLAAGGFWLTRLVRENRRLQGA